jgi:hypothetical protein
VFLHTEQDDDNDLDDGDGGDLVSFRTHLPPRTEDEDDMVIVNNTSTTAATSSTAGTTAAASAAAAAASTAAAAASSEAAMACHTTEALELLISTLRSGSSALDDTGTLLCVCHKSTCVQLL